MLPDCVTTLLGIQGFRVKAVEQIGNLPGRSTVRVHLERAMSHFFSQGRGGSGAGDQGEWQEPFRTVSFFLQ